MSDFLPKDYKRPEVPGDYMKLKLGSNTFRVVSKPVMGFVGWTENEKQEKKPVRRSDGIDFADVNLIQAPKFFWGLEVYNYATERLQLLEITQVSILDKIELLATNPAWGDPVNYDLVITRSGEGLKTEYDTQSNPPVEMNNTVKEALTGKRADLDRWFKGGDAYLKDSDISSDPASEAAATAEATPEQIIGGTGVAEDVTQTTTEPPPATESDDLTF